MGRRWNGHSGVRMGRWTVDGWEEEREAGLGPADILVRSSQSLPFSVQVWIVLLVA